MKSASLVSRNIAVFAYRHQQQYAAALDTLFFSLENAGFNLKFHSDFATYASETKLLSYPIKNRIENLPADTDVILSIGGDGTFLRAAAWAENSQTPIMGINSGHLGYLTSYTLDDINPIVTALTENKYKIESRSKLTLSPFSACKNMWPYALNEITIHKEETSSMLSIEASVDGELLANYQADGLILSTPTGSTAYNLAAGGPIVQPTLRCVVLTPIAPHTLTLRPIIISADTNIRLHIKSRADRCRISIDNRSFILPTDTEITISPSPFDTKIIRPLSDSFTLPLRSKLHWGME